MIVLSGKNIVIPKYSEMKKHDQIKNTILDYLKRGETLSNKNWLAHQLSDSQVHPELRSSFEEVMEVIEEMT